MIQINNHSHYIIGAIAFSTVIYTSKYTPSIRRPILGALAAIGLISILYNAAYKAGFKAGGAQSLEKLNKIEAALRKPHEDFVHKYLKLNKTIRDEFQKLIHLTRPRNLQDLPFATEDASKDYVGWFVSIMNFLNSTKIVHAENTMLRSGKTCTPEGDPPFDCPICLEKDKQGERFLTDCNHSMCTGCANEALEKAGPDCPECRAPLQAYKLSIDNSWQIFKETDQANEHLSLMFTAKQTTKEYTEIPLSTRAEDLCQQYSKLYQTLNEHVGNIQKAFLENLLEVHIPQHRLCQTRAISQLSLSIKKTYPYQTQNIAEASFPKTYALPSNIPTATNEI